MRRTPLLVLLLTTIVHADVVLHEYIPNAGDAELDAVLGPGGEPAAIVYDDTILTAPEGGARRDDERAMSAMPGDGQGREEEGRRSPTFRPDRVTSLEGTLGYFETFTPALAPFKRVSALDAVVTMDGGTPVLGVSSLRTSRLPIEGASSAPPDARERERFWGSVVLDFRAGAIVPLPSVSPESRILTLRTELLGDSRDASAGNEVDLEVHRDDAGSYFAVAPPGVRDEVRVVFLTDAPKDFFRMAELPDVPSDTFADEVFALEPRVREDALLFARELGLSPGQSYRRTLPILVEHFRSFEESDEPPPSTGNIFLDLARGMKGVCRHRAYPFVITAQALGMPARFVQNEAHAWVEVKIPQGDVPGWLRIDLGGAAAGLDAHGAEDRPLHRPTGDDVLPRPAPYVRSYSQLAGNVRGLRRDAPGANASNRANDDPSTNASDPSADPSTDPSATTTPTTSPRAPNEPANEPANEPSPPSTDPLSALFSTPEPTRPVARPLRLTVEGREFEVLRGRRLELVGRALDPDDVGVAGLRVEVVARGTIERLLGVTVTREGGHWQASVGVPPELPVGDYTLVVRTPGSDRYFPATAR